MTHPFQNAEDMAWATGLRQVRLARGLTQEQLGARLGLRKPEVCELEAGKRPMTVKTLRRLGRWLELSTSSVIHLLQWRPDDDADLIDEDPRDQLAADLSSAWGFEDAQDDETLAEYAKVLSQRLAEQRHQLVTLLEMLRGDEVERARDYLHVALYTNESEVSQ